MKKRNGKNVTGQGGTMAERKVRKRAGKTGGPKHGDHLGRMALYLKAVGSP